MPVIFIDGMDYCDAPRWSGTISPFTPALKYTSYNRIGVSIEPGRVSNPALGGGNSIQFNSVGFGVQTYTKLFGFARPSYCLGFARQMISITSPSTNLCRFESGPTVPGSSGGENSDTVLMLAIMSADQTISIYTGPQGLTPTPGTLLWNSVGVFAVPLNEWLYYELFVDTASGTWAIYVNDVLLQTQTGVPLPGGIDRFSIQSQVFEANIIDDLYCTDGERLGPCRVTGFPPNFGSTHQWTPLEDTNLSQIQEFGNRFGFNTPDDNQSYVAASSPGLTDYYGFAGPACYGRILALALNVDGSATAGSPSVDFLIKLAGTEFGAGSSDAYVGGYAIKQGIADRNPLTGVFWTDADIASGLFGYRMASSGSLKITQFMMEKLVSLRNVPFSCGQGSYSYVA